MEIRDLGAFIVYWDGIQTVLLLCFFIKIGVPSGAIRTVGFGSDGRKREGNEKWEMREKGRGKRENGGNLVRIDIRREEVGGMRRNGENGVSHEYPNQ